MTNRFFNSNEDLKKQFRRLVKELHPDHGGNAEDFKAMMKEYEDNKNSWFQSSGSSRRHHFIWGTKNST